MRCLRKVFKVNGKAAYQQALPIFRLEVTIIVTL